MADVRELCKIFLEFVYDNNILPEGIVKILKENKYDGKSYYWDFRLVCRLLAFKDKYYSPKTGGIEEDLGINAPYFFTKDFDVWCDTTSGQYLRNLQLAANDFFHDVNAKDMVFEPALKELISRAQKPNSDEFIARIESLTVPNKETSVHDTPKVNTVVVPKPTTISAPVSVPTTKEEKNKNEWPRTKVRQYCIDNGYMVSSIYNSISENSKIHGIYWANPDPENLKYDWDLILNYADERCFRIFRIPANTFTPKDFYLRNNNKTGQVLIQLEIDKGTHIDTISNVNFHPYLVKEIKY